MLVVETIGRIRREHFVKGKSIKEIVRDLKISRKALRSGETAFDQQREAQLRPKLGRRTQASAPARRGPSATRFCSPPSSAILRGRHGLEQDIARTGRAFGFRIEFASRARGRCA
jgi:hypothetical protein